MDPLTWFANATADKIGAVALVSLTVLLILTGRLVPWWTVRRELAAEKQRADEHRAASEKKDEAIEKLLAQNSNLIAGIRIADKFFGDFLPDPATKPKEREPDDLR